MRFTRPHRTTGRSGCQRIRTRGLSLVEVMIAIAILSIALVALLTKVHGAIDTARVTEYQNAARELAKQLLADIEAGTVEDVMDGMNGNFGDPRGSYPEITWMIGRGDSSTVGMSTNPADVRRLYDKRASSDNPFGLPADTDVTTPADPNTEEPLTRVRIVVNFPTSDPEKVGTFMIERMLPTECVNGTRGLQDKKEKDAGLAAQEAKSGAPATPPAGGGGGNNRGSGGPGGAPSGFSSGLSKP